MASQKDSIFKLKKDDLALVVMDVQEKLVRTMDPDEWEFTESKIRLLIETAKEFQIPIFLTEQYPKGLGPTISTISKALKDYEQVIQVEKLEFSAMANEEFQKKWLDQKKRQALIVGLECHICVAQTALDLLEKGNHVFVPNDAVISRHAEDFGAGLDFMEKGGAIIISSEMALFQLLGRAGTPEFKKLSQLIKD